MEDRKIDFSRYRRAADNNSEVERQLHPEPHQERQPTFFQRSQERERGDSSWSGSSMGGGTWAGRSR